MKIMNQTENKQSRKAEVTSSGNYEILPPLPAKASNKCTCCGDTVQHLPLDTELYNGFGGWQVNKNGALFYQADSGDWDNSKTLSDIEVEAALDPNNDWQAVLYTPLRGATYQRQNDKWVLVEVNEGFA